MTGENEFYLNAPPFFDLSEIIEWIELQLIGSAEPTAQSMLDSIALLEEKLRDGSLRAYASIDTSPIRPIDQWNWAEFEIFPATPDGRAIRGPNRTRVDHFVVLSLKTYRAAALKDVSQRSDNQVPGLGALEPGYYRVMDQLVFLETNVRQVFPTDNVSVQAESLNDYAQALREIEGGRYFHSHAPHSKADVARMIYDHWKAQNRRPEKTLSTIQRNVSRHYDKFGEGGQ
ncbi:hypothetical protein [Bradyrhizobium diazoefficiens]